MSTYNVRFLWKNQRNINILGLKKKMPYLELCTEPIDYPGMFSSENMRSHFMNIGLSTIHAVF